MILHSITRKQTKQIATSSTQSWTSYKRYFVIRSSDFLPISGTTKETSSSVKDELAKEVVKGMLKKKQAQKEARALEKDFFFSVINSAATKRDAKSYIQRFTPRNGPILKNPKEVKNLAGCGVNLGGFYGPAAVEDSPKFLLQQPAYHTDTVQGTKCHIAIVKFRAPQLLKDETIAGIGRTLSQLGRLGLLSIVVLDYHDTHQPLPAFAERDARIKEFETEQATRILSAIEKGGETRARLVDNIIGIDETVGQQDYQTEQINIAFPDLLENPLKRGLIPVLQPTGYTSTTHTAFAVPADNIILAITREFANITLDLSSYASKITSQACARGQKQDISVDRLIILDPLGGIPTTDLPNGYHVFLNMEQEYESAKQVLLRDLKLSNEKRNILMQQMATKVSKVCDKVPTSNIIGTSNSTQNSLKTSLNLEPKRENSIHLENLQLIRSVLSMLPKTSSAILTSPEEVANSHKNDLAQPAQVGTRRQLNPLIHNLLTDKPIFSSSLPISRRGKLPSTTPVVYDPEKPTPTTFAKHGMAVHIYPNPKISPWTSPKSSNFQISLTSSEIDLSRLVYLINDSFGRTLDVPAYLKRVNNRIAGIIVAGAYEGGAILTWESPPGVDPENTTRMVPYLDKFAVLRRSQGNGGVADLIFNAMVRDCFPQGVVWRSRKNNPVNKWYFERSRGSWKLPNSGWTMFWTTPEASKNTQLFHDYENVCRGIEPSWVDIKEQLD
ncbi:Amino-acid acetyltransferase [Podosphaera aphanis]|nr:Amino-acid acetyltransferase [Podosphaera aphanis]